MKTKIKWWHFFTGQWSDLLETRSAKEEYAKHMISVGTQLYFTAIGVFLIAFANDVSRWSSSQKAGLLILSFFLAVCSFLIRGVAFRKLDQISSSADKPAGRKT